ncbi:MULTISPECIES: DUF5606 domain-containing protein [unclassified Polaribacter]|uniref:DUF5606 family protein n=1 Tax=unclassified Polaribacter TaxID=196858 RepID=UPI0011BE5835|nr:MULTISPECIES: DUF5606 domain-containing protein [unclassified Polaribacter]TXD52972.1 hypothetical protein ES043_06260 [Polaribacter sp. IC063]TXD60937.1 hypothetical protein ES044_06210 [Polaribacter sp. IC066]
MEFSKIISVTGKPGLFQVVSQSKNAIIVSSLADQKRIAINSTQNVSLLENIAIYTFEEDVPLLNVFKAMFEKTEGKEALSHKESGKKLAAFFTEVLPNYDDERVYTSNIKKVIQWFNILVATGMDFAAIAETSKKETESES